MLFLNEYYHITVSKPNNDIINTDTTTTNNKNNNTNDIHLYNTAIECYILKQTKFWSWSNVVLKSN